MHPDLEKLVTIAGKALQDEDTFIMDAIVANNAAFRNYQCGIMHFLNERYYQYIIARALAKEFPYPAIPEFDWRDLVLHYPANKSKWFAVVEMKCWMSTKGNTELDGIRQDIEKLRHVNAENRLLLIFSANPPGITDKNIGELSQEVGLTSTQDITDWLTVRFPTVNQGGKNVEFWVAGYQVK